MSESMHKIFDIGFVPLIVLEDKNDAVPLARALVAGGIPVAEVTFRTSAGRGAIAAMAKEVPEIIVGAGTVHNVLQAEEAVEAGAKFIVTPGFNPDVIRWCLERNIDIIPGCTCPGEIEQAMGMGLKTLKFFPAEAYGGIKTLKALSGPYAGIKFMPTGGVNSDNMLDYLSLPNVAAVGGSWLNPDKLIKAKEWDKITALCKESINKMLGFELLHVGINTRDDDDAKKVATAFGSLFSLQITEFPGAYFAGSMVEVIKGNFLGSKGHIAIKTNDIERAAAYFKRLGVEFNTETENRDDKGNLITIYFKEEIGGFAIHLRKK